jgi:hypothetical protein
MNARGEEREELRRKVKGALGRLVSAMWMLVVSRGRDRLIAIQVNFRGSDARRRYVICYRPARVDLGGSHMAVALTVSWEAVKWVLPDDISTPKGCRDAEKALLKVPYELNLKTGMLTFNDTFKMRVVLAED